MNPIDLPREIQDLVPLLDEEIKDRLQKSGRLVEIFHHLKREQISHVEKTLADRFVHIIEESEIDPSIKSAIVGVFKDVASIGFDLSSSEIEKIVVRSSLEQLVSNWSFFSENNKKRVVLALINVGSFDDLLQLINRVDVDLTIFTDEKTPLLLFVYNIIKSKKEDPESGIYERQMEILKALIEKGADPNAIGKRRLTLLEKVINSDDDLVLSGLIELGANPNVSSKHGIPLLHIAYLEGHKKILSDLLVNEKVDLNIRDSRGLTLLAVAYENKDDEMVNRLLSLPQTDPNARTSTGTPFIIEAFRGGHMRLVHRLVEDNRIDLNRKDGNGYTLLYLALKNRHPDLPRLLLSNNKIDPNVQTNNGTSIFDEIIKYDYSMTGISPKKYDYRDPALVLPVFLQHPKVTNEDRNACKLYMAVKGSKWELAKEILVEREINIHLKDCLSTAVSKGQFEIVQDLLRRGADPRLPPLSKVCEEDNQDMARILFDAGSRFDPEDPDTGAQIAEILFPNWDWEEIIEDPEQNIIAFLSDPSQRRNFLYDDAEDVNPLELFLVYPNPELYVAYMDSLTPEEQYQYIDGLRKKFPNKALFLGFKSSPTPPKEQERILPDIGQYTLEDAIASYHEYFGRINFTDPKGSDYVPPDRILDQGKKCTAEELKGYGDSFCLYMEDPKNSKFAQERKDSQSYQRLRKKILYVMHYIRGEVKKLEEGNDLSDVEKIRIKKNIDKLLMLIAGAGNHCILAKYNVLGEIEDIAFGVAYVPTMVNQIAHILQRYRLGVLEKLFTDEGTDPPTILSHQMYAFMLTHEKDLGILIEDLVRDDPFMEGIDVDQQNFLRYQAANSPAKQVLAIARELQGRGSEISPESFKQWLIENPLQEWNQYDELLYDLEQVPEDLGYAYLARNFSIYPTPEEMLELLNPPNLPIHREKFKKIEHDVSQQYRTIQEQQLLEIESMKESMEGMIGLEKEKMQARINKMKLELPLLSGKKMEDQKKLKFLYLEEQGIVLTPKEYVLALKAKEDPSVIRKEMNGKSIDQQWEVLEGHDIHKQTPYEVLAESDKEGEELNAITIELSDKSEEEQWQVLAQHKISNPNAKTPLEALEKNQAVQYANQTYVDGMVRKDRVARLLLFANQIQVAAI